MRVWEEEGTAREMEVWLVLGGAGRKGAAATDRALGGVPGGPEEAQGLCGQGSWLWTLGWAA